MSHSRKKFVPYPEQVLTARRRIQGYLERNNGAIEMGSALDVKTLHRHISQQRDLGRHYQQQCITLKLALEQLLREHLIAWDSEMNMLGVTYKFERHKRQNSSQRYIQRRHIRHAVA